VEPILIKRKRSNCEVFGFIKKENKFYKNGTKKGRECEGGLVLKGGKMKLLWKGGTHVTFNL
jgi:hypothetical protein